MKIYNRILFILFLAAVLMAACTSADEPTPTQPPATSPPEETLPPDEPPKPEDFSPLSEEECEELGKAIADAVGIDGVMTFAPFEEFTTGESGTGCLTTITGDGNDFDNFWDVFNTLKAVLEDRGWQEDAFIMADGPTGHVGGFRYMAKLCLLHVGWDPSEDADCPDDQPIGMCDLAPEQKIYTIELNCAE